MRDMTSQQTYGVLHLFAGIGGAALGMQAAESEYRGVRGSFITLAGIDCDPEACADFEMLTGAPAVQMDLFSQEDYIAFHGHEPPPQWREATPADLRKATEGIAPDVIFTSPPCKGFSGLLPTKSAKSQKYQALNRLTVRGLRLALEAFADDLPGIILLENVPRITSRGADLLREIKNMLGARGYLFHEGYHDCGSIGGLGQHRKRYLLIARLPAKVSSFVYQPPQLRVRSIGEIIGPLPMPDDPAGGVMHRLPRLQWKTWVRLALIPAGGDWRDLEKIAPEQYRLEYIPRDGAFRVGQWDRPASTVIGSAGVRGSNGMAAISDPRIRDGVQYHDGAYKISRWESAAPTVTGGSPATSSGKCISDPRLPSRDTRHPGVYRVVRWDEPGPCVTGTRFGSGAPAVADNRIGGGYSNKRKILEWDEPATTVTGTPDIQSGAQSVGDPLKYLFRDGPWCKNDKTTWGAAQKATGKEKHLTGYDFFIIINFEIWRCLDQASRIALVDHELSHCIQKDGYDEEGNPKWGIVGHDLEDFLAVVRRHGLWTESVRRMAEVMEMHRQPNLLDHGLNDPGRGCSEDKTLRLVEKN